MNNHLKLSLLGALLATSVVVCYAKPSFEMWRTTIPCGTQKFEVESRCKKAADSMELNTCEAGQTLSTGKISRRVPTLPAAQGKPVLYATHWSCLDTREGPVLRLGYFAGYGRSADDEGEEFFDRKLRPIKNPSALRKLYKLMPKAKEGYIKSIMPD